MGSSMVEFEPIRKRRYGPSVKPLFHMGASSEGAYPSKPKCGTGAIRCGNASNPTVPAASRKLRRGTGQNLFEDSHANRLR